MQRLNFALPLKGLCLTLGTILGLTLLPSNALAQQVTLTQWNFNNSSTTPNINITTGNPTGTPSVSLVGGVTASSFLSGSGSSDRESLNRAWQTSNYPAQGSGNKTGGVEFDASTVGYQNITVSWDQRFSDTASKNVQFQYSTNGTTFVDFANPSTVNGLFTVGGGNTWSNNNTVNLSGISEVNNNPNFSFRIVSAFDTTNVGNYVAANPGSNYGSGGTWRFDMVTVTATPVPEPFTIIGSLTALGIGTVIKRKYASAGQIK